MCSHSMLSFETQKSAQNFRSVRLSQIHLIAIIIIILILLVHHTNSDSQISRLRYFMIFYQYTLYN